MSSTSKFRKTCQHRDTLSRNIILLGPSKSGKTTTLERISYFINLSLPGQISSYLYPFNQQIYPWAKKYNTKNQQKPNFWEIAYSCQFFNNIFYNHQAFSIEKTPLNSKNSFSVSISNPSDQSDIEMVETSGLELLENQNENTSSSYYATFNLEIKKEEKIFLETPSKFDINQNFGSFENQNHTNHNQNTITTCTKDQNSTKIYVINSAKNLKISKNYFTCIFNKFKNQPNSYRNIVILLTFCDLKEAKSEREIYEILGLERFQQVKIFSTSNKFQKIDMGLYALFNYVCNL